MIAEDFLPNPNCWLDADTVQEAVDDDCAAAFIQVRLGNKRLSDERLLYMAVNRKFKVLKTAIALGVAEKKEPRVGKIIEWMIASQCFGGRETSCDLKKDGKTIAEAIAPALKFLSQNDWNRIVGRVFNFVNEDIEVVRKVLKLFGKTTEREEIIEDTKTYVIPGKYDQITATNIGGFYVMDRDFCSCCDYEEAKAIAAELGEYGWRLPSKDEMETIHKELPTPYNGADCYTDEIYDEKYDLGCCLVRPEKDEEGLFDTSVFKVSPRIYDFFPFRDRQFGRKYLGYCMWVKNGSIFSIPIGYESKWIVPGRKFKEKKISIRLIRDPDLIVKDIPKTNGTAA